MTVTSNIHVGLPAWVNQVYAVGNRISTGGNAYQCVVGGTSTVAPTGTGSSISTADGLVWKWLSAIDFTTVQSWVLSWPATLVDNMLGLLWNDSVITATAGTPIMSASGHTMGSFTATLTPAAGEGIRPTYLQNVAAIGLPTMANGVLCTLPAAVGNVNYFNISDPNVIIDGLQIQDPFPTSNSSLVSFNAGANGGILRNSLLSGFGQASLGSMLEPNANCILYNCAIIDNATVGPGFTVHTSIAQGSNALVKIVNCTFYAAAGSVPSNLRAIRMSGPTVGSYTRNCIYAGYAAPVVDAT